MDQAGEFRDGYAEIGDQRLHYVEVGEGPLIVLLHGFPEFWYGWRLQRKLSQGLHHPGQLRKSWYFFFFDLPELPESIVHASHWHFFRHFLRDASPGYTPDEIDRYIEAWSQPGAAAGMINYYRSSVRTPPKQAEAALRPIKAPTLVIWGQRDRYLGEDLAEPDHDDVPNLDRVERLPDASHWVHHDEAERVNQLLAGFSAQPGQPGPDWQSVPLRFAENNHAVPPVPEGLIAAGE
ncbi:MAG: alpha/beta fold hydrolase [Streptosporangiaceae bacterium]